MSVAEDFMEAVKKLLSGNKKRDVALNSLFVKVENALYDYEEESYSYPWIIELMSGSNGQYAIFSDGGKLFRADFSIDVSDNIEITETFEVKVDYPKVESQSRVTVFRSKDDELLWIGIASSSVLNRSGEIDSTKLFDDFEDNFSDYDEPYITLQHLPEEFSFGKVRGVFRLDSLLIAYGAIDEETVLGQFAEERFNSGEWGMSIGFMPTSPPEMFRVGDVEIPIYNGGRLVEISVLLEERAAAYFTKIIGSEKGKNRMANKTKDQAKKLLLEFSGDKAEDDIDELLDEAGKRERQISDEELITRNNEEDAEDEEEDTEEVGDGVSDDVVNDEVIDEEIEFVLDENTITKIVNSVSKEVNNLFGDKFKEITEFRESVTSDLNELTESFNKAGSLLEELKQRTTVTEERLDTVERDDTKKIRDAVDDLPISQKRTVTVTHRPTEDNSDDNKTPKTTRDIANETLHNIGANGESN